MELTLTYLYFAMLALLLQVVTFLICARHPALKSWLGIFQIVAFVWLGIAIFKKLYVDEFYPPNDGLLHEAVAREVADQLTSGNFSQALSNLAIGNPAYQFLLGTFYSLTNAPEIVTYAINGAFAYWGLLVLLEVLCRQTNCSRLPLSVVLIFTLLPSALLWSTKNLKEGPVLWGICMMCYLTIPACQFRGPPPRVLASLGLVVVMLMRPHIAMAWLLAIGAGMLFHTRRFGLLFVSGVGAVLCIWLLSVLRPATFEEAVADGATTALSNRYEKLSNLTGAGSSPISGENPIPVWSGLELILFRPWPTETQSLDAFVAGLEVWLLAAFGLRNWTIARGKRDQRLHPGLLTYLILLLLMGFFFTYMYNMGLVVRQRLMCFPAVLALYSWPLLTKHTMSNRILRTSACLTSGRMNSSAANLAAVPIKYKGRSKGTNRSGAHAFPTHHHN